MSKRGKEDKTKESLLDLIRPDKDLPDLSTDEVVSAPESGSAGTGDLSQLNLTTPDGHEASSDFDGVPGLDPGMPAHGTSAEEVSRAFDRLMAPDHSGGASFPDPMAGLLSPDGHELSHAPDTPDDEADLASTAFDGGMDFDSPMSPGAISEDSPPHEPPVAETSLEGDSDPLAANAPAPDLGADLSAVPEEEAPPTPGRTSPAPTGAQVMENVARFSNQAVAAGKHVAAAYPFSLLIDGPLKVEEREKLLSVLARAELGIREPDLEPQFESGRVLIPRISEYAGVLIVQSLRSASVNFRLGPADSIFATADTRTEDVDTPLPPADRVPDQSHGHGHPADGLPVTREAALPELPRARVIDVVNASGALSTTAVEAEKSAEYGDLLEALQRELKFKAYRRGAQAVVNFSVSLVLLSSPSRYRLTVSGCAVRSAGTDSPSTSGPEPLKSL